MKKIILVCLLLIVSIAFFKLRNQITSTVQNPQVQTETAQKPSPNDLLELSQKKASGDFGNFIYESLLVSPENDIDLIANFDEKLTSVAIATQSGCQALVSGSFYTQDFRPLGMFYSQKQLLRKYSANRLIDAVLSKSSDDGFDLNLKQPDLDTIEWAIQTGPMLVNGGQILNLKIQNDEPARRIIAAVTDDSDLIFIVIYGSENIFTGPYLQELPRIVGKIGDIEQIDITAAANLDGGSASAFVHESNSLGELSVIGSAFCIR